MIFITPHQSLIKAPGVSFVTRGTHFDSGMFFLKFPFGIWRVELRIGVREHQLPSSVCTDDFTLRTAPYVLLRHSRGFQHAQQAQDSLGFSVVFFFSKEPAACHGEGRGGGARRGGSCGRDVFGKQNCSMQARGAAKVNNRGPH